MKSRLSTLILVAVVAACSVSILPLNQVAAQDDQRGMRVQQESLTGRRVALVIGNSAYKDSPLLNPVNDARAIAQALRRFGFEVIHGEDLSQNDMKRNIRAFGEKIRNGGVGLFYYAGHGIQIRGSNYLIPVGATIASEEEVEYESVDVGLVLAQMETARNQLNIVILDACRNNPFARSFRSAQRGLASIDAPGGTLIAYATAPGSVASDGAERNGLYTQQLLKYMLIPELSIEQVFKQVRVAVRSQSQGKQIPWESSSLERDFYFSSSNLTAPEKASSPIATESHSDSPSSVNNTIEAELSKFVGVYELKTPPLEVSIEMLGGKLKSVIPGQPSGMLVPVAANRFKVVVEGVRDDIFVEFHMSDGRANIMMIEQGGMKFTFLRKPK
jgi:hypothetical protein